MRLIDKKELARRVPFSPSSIARWEKDGTFPKRVKIGKAGLCAWPEAEVDAWIKARMSERSMSLDGA